MVYLYDIEYKNLDSLNEPYHHAQAIVCGHKIGD